MTKGIKMTDMVKGFNKAQGNINKAAMMRNAANVMGAVTKREAKTPVNLKEALERYL